MTERAPGAERRILIVEDDPALALGLCDALEFEGFAVVHAKNGKEGIDALARDGEPDLILLDINMPVMDGLEFMAQAVMTENKRRVPVVIVTTEGQPEDVKRGMDAGARAYLRKPFKADELLKVVHQMIGQEAPAAVKAQTS